MTNVPAPVAILDSNIFCPTPTLASNPTTSIPLQQKQQNSVRKIIQNVSNSLTLYQYGMTDIDRSKEHEITETTTNSFNRP